MSRKAPKRSASPGGRPDAARQLVDIVLDPVAFAQKMLRADTWAVQEDILRSVAKNGRTAVKACHSSGKTFLAGQAVLWWLAQGSDRIVITTAPTWIQVDKLLWGEIHAALRRSRIRFPEPSRTELRIGPQNYALGLSTNEGVRFQGFKGKVLVILDEAPGVKPEIWDAIEGIRASGDVRVLALGNPTMVGGPFHEAFTTNREGWATFTISAFDTPNFQGVTLETLLAMSEEQVQDNPRPYLCLKSWVRERFREWGPTHPMWEARVLGQFPTHADDTLIPLSWCERAALEPMRDTGGSLRIGIDWAGPGEDETVLVAVDGPQICGMWTWTGLEAEGHVQAKLREYFYRIAYIGIDKVGLGEYPTKHIQDMFRDRPEVVVDAINVGEEPRDKEKFKNKKAEAYWGLRERFSAGDIMGLRNPALPLDEQNKLIAQLSSIKYTHNARGQVEIESKEDARKRGVKSPDRAEALMLAYASPQHVAGVTASHLSGERRQRADWSEVA